MKLEELEKSAVKEESTALVNRGCSSLTVIERNGPHYIYLMDPVTKQVERRWMGSIGNFKPDNHLGGIGGE